jgi:uncharacterized protein (TIGR02265 family)
MSGRVKGTVLLSRKAFVEERFGKDKLESVLTSMTPADQTLLRGMVLPLSWYDAEACQRFDAAIIKVIGGNAEQAFRDLGRKSADDNLGKFQAGFVRGKAPLSFLAQTPAIYRLYYEIGSREFTKTNETSGVLTTHGAESVTTGDCLTVMGWHERALEMVGAKRPVITHPKCRAMGADTCSYHVSWS